MQIVSALLHIDKTLPTPVYQQIANDIICHIRQGTLKPAMALPSSRALASALKIHRNTVVAAYDELYAQSWVDVYPKKGIFIAANLPEVTPRALVSDVNFKKLAYPGETHFNVCDKKLGHVRLFNPGIAHSVTFNEGFPDTRLAPVELMLREYRRFANYQFTQKYLLYGPEQGSENLRVELATFLSETRGLHVQPEHILITKGAQMAIYLAAQLLLDKGDVVTAGDPGYCGANEVFEQTGAKLALVPVDEHGIDLDAVETICKTQKVKMLYVIPHHHQPTTVTLSSERRMRLLELAMKYGFAIIEDDYDYDFHYSSSPILPLASADYYGSVIYVGSFCKTIAPGIRIGFMVAPPNLIREATKMRRLIDRQGEQLLEEAMANLLKNGDITRHLKKANKLYHERRDIFCKLLQEQVGEHISFKIPDGGFAIWLKYNNGLQPSAVAEKATAMGLGISAGKDYYYDPNHQHQNIRLGFASMNVKEMELGVDLFAKAIKKAL